MRQIGNAKITLPQDVFNLINIQLITSREGRFIGGMIAGFPSGVI